MSDRSFLLGSVRKLIDDFLDSRVGATAAEVAAQSVADLLRSRVGILVEKSFSRDDKTRRAEAALLGIIFDEGSLHGTELIAVHEPLGGRDRFVLRLDGEDRARVHRFVVYKHSAGAAGAAIADPLRTGDLKFLTQRIEQRDPRLQLRGVLLSVHRQRDVAFTRTM